jgi:hypothetical protein
MLWLNHPKFIRVRDEILQAVQKNEYRFRRTPNVLFLCGAIESKARERLAEYVEKKRTDTLVSYAEDVWTKIAQVAELGNPHKGYHIDYVFADEKLHPRGIEVFIGSHAEWLMRSDHAPLVCDFLEHEPSSQ